MNNLAEYYLKQGLKVSGAKPLKGSNINEVLDAVVEALDEITGVPRTTIETHESNISNDELVNANVPDLRFIVPQGANDCHIYRVFSRSEGVNPLQNLDIAREFCKC